MRAFLISCLAIIILAIGALVLVNTAQRTAAAAYVGDGARINPRWSVRRIMKHEAPAPGQVMPVGQHVGQGVEGGECEVASALAWLMVDFGGGANDNPGCQ